MVDFIPASLGYSVTCKTTEIGFISRCGRFSCRQGSKGSMVLTDKHTGQVHVVKGKVPQVEKFAESLSK